MSYKVSDLKFLIDVSTNAFLETDAAGMVVLASRNAHLIFGGESPEGKFFTEIFDESAAPVVKKRFEACLKTRRPENFCISNAGRFYNCYLYPRSGRQTAVCLEDITERRQLSEILHKTTTRMNFAERTARLGYWELDLTARKIYWSAEMYRIFGVEAKNVSVKRNIIREQVIAEDLPLYKQKIIELIKKRRPVEGMLRVRRPDGRLVHCLFKAGLVFEGEGQKVAGTFQDLTRLIEIQQALEKAKTEAERLNREKSYFLAQASHDLRQPMQALNIFIATLGEEKLAPEQCRLVSKIEESANNLYNMLDNFLDISKLEAGGVEKENREFDMGKLLSSLGQEFKIVAECRGIRFRFVNCSCRIVSDPVLVERILRNLLSNAFKYTRDRILLGCRRLRGGRIKVMVCDNGIGIAKQDQEKIFEEFFQSEQNSEQKKQGAGLGLAIVRKIAALLGTEIRLSSAPGHGSCFSFVLKTFEK